MSVTPNPDAPITGLGNFIPMAQVYKTNGDYNNYVPVQVTDDGKELLSFPDPSDINADASPIQMANGFLLDRRGVSENTRFTSYTYTQYAALKQIPSPQELFNSIIPEARIIELVVLPITAQEAYADTSAVNNIIRTGFNNCKFLISTPAVEP